MNTVIAYICDLCHSNPETVKFILIAAGAILVAGAIFIWIMAFALSSVLGEIESAVSGSIKSAFLRINPKDKK